MIRNNDAKPYFLEYVFLQARLYAEEVARNNPGLSFEMLEDKTTSYILSIKNRGRYKPLIKQQVRKAVIEILKYQAGSKISSFAQ